MILCVLFMILAPLFLGLNILIVCKKRSVVSIYAQGLLLLFVLTSASTLIYLKADLNFPKLIFIFSLSVFAFSATGLLIFAISRKKGLVFCNRISKELWIYVVLGILFFVLTKPTFVNDDTWEFVATTIANNDLWKEASLTGYKLVNGFPIYNKIYAPPVFYAILVKTFSCSMWFVGGILLPGIVLVINFYLIDELLLELTNFTTSDKRLFYFIYSAVLFCSTYLPANGIPITAGFSILCEGYSGYAIFFCILLPLVALGLAKRDYTLVFGGIISTFSLLRIDRIYYALISPMALFKVINTSGKLIVLILLALLCNYYFMTNKTWHNSWCLILTPSVFVASLFTFIGRKLTGKKEKIFYLFGVLFLLLSICNFKPFDKAGISFSPKKQEASVVECIGFIREFSDDAVIWSSEGFMSEVRRIDGRQKVLYSRAYNNRLMAGLDYEPVSEHLEDYSNFVKNKSYWADYLSLSCSQDELIDIAIGEGVNVFVLPKSDYHNDADELLTRNAFSYLAENEDYIIYILDK